MRKVLQPRLSSILADLVLNTSAFGRGALAPLIGGAQRLGRKESAVKPGSVVDSHSSGIRVTAQLKRPTRKPVCGPHTAAKGAACFPIWSCSRWGLPCRWCCHPRGALLPHHFTLTGTACAALRRYLSVALSVGSRLPGVTWHRALRSPDFPPPLRAATVWPTPGRTIRRYAP
jgi:hypothetical protein